MMLLEYPGVTGSGEVYLKVLKAICGDTEGKSMVDLMCHKAPYTSQLGFKERTYVDAQDRGLDCIEEQQYFIKSDVFEYFETCNKYFNVSIASDSIEHLSFADGEKLVRLMQRFSDMQIIFTPLGEWMVDKDSIHPDTHKSGWHNSYFEEHGWATIVYPHFHKQLSVGAFFAIKCDGIENEFSAIKNRLNI
jgi:hypothetical protein